jgi:molybdopterin-guanine dinucleotide biosynthesis protein A
MLRHNLPGIRYSRYRFFVGCYPNDRLTIDAVREAMAQLPEVRLTMVPHDGPTSKADCLNWIYQGMRAYEEDHGDRFDVVVIHDAEDLIQLGAYAAGTNPALDASIRMRPELLEFLRQDHTVSSPLPETLSRLQDLAARLEAGPQLVRATPNAKR